MNGPHQIASAANETAAEKVWTQVDHSRAAKRGSCRAIKPEMAMIEVDARKVCWMQVRSATVRG
jgi:hypothetical protein